MIVIGIGNAIHTFAGMQLRLACRDIMLRQKHEEPAGMAKMTPAYNLPCRYVLHTVGPVVQGRVTQRNQELLASCYRACLDLGGRSCPGQRGFLLHFYRGIPLPP